MKSDLRYYVDYDYDTQHDCDNGCANDFCRCGTITNKRILSVDVMAITEHIYKSFFDETSKSGKRAKKLSDIFSGGKEIDMYCINRILTFHKIWEPDNWEIGTEGGYYGEEIGEVSLDGVIMSNIERDCELMLSLDSISDKIKFVLHIEYGYLLDDIKDSQFDIITISKNDLDFTKMSKTHITKVKSENLDHYNGYNLPRGIVRRSLDGSYKIIDGFHRIISVDGDFKKFKAFSTC